MNGLDLKETVGKAISVANKEWLKLPAYLCIRNTPAHVLWAQTSRIDNAAERDDKYKPVATTQGI